MKSSYLRFTKIQYLLFRCDFRKALLKENFIVTTCFKTVTSFFAALHYFLERINPINCCKYNKFHPNFITGLQKRKISFPYSFYSLSIESPFFNAPSVGTMVRLRQIEFVMI